MTGVGGLLVLVWVIAAVAFVAGVIVGRAIQVWSQPAPSTRDYDTGYQDCLHALGWASGYNHDAEAPRRVRRNAWRLSWREKAAR